MNQKILKLVEERLEEGKRKYGHENVETDGRDFIVEALEEILDCCVYIAAKLVEIQNNTPNYQCKIENCENSISDIDDGWLICDAHLIEEYEKGH